MTMSRHKIRRNTKILFKQQNGLCYYCGTDLMFLREKVTKKFLSRNRHLAATFDHVVPRKEGGTYALTNGVCACAHCNVKKGKKSYKEFIKTYDPVKAREMLKLYQPGDPKPQTLKQQRIKRKRKQMFMKNSMIIAWFALITNTTPNELTEIFKLNLNLNLGRD